MEKVLRIHDISFFQELRDILNGQIRLKNRGPRFANDAHGHLLFSRVVDRLRLAIHASAQGIAFHRRGRGSTLKNKTRELYSLLQSVGLSFDAIARLVNAVLNYWEEYYPFMTHARCAGVEHPLVRQLDPAYVLCLRKSDKNAARRFQEGEKGYGRGDSISKS